MCRALTVAECMTSVVTLSINRVAVSDSRGKIGSTMAVVGSFLNRAVVIGAELLVHATRNVCEHGTRNAERGLAEIHGRIDEWVGILALYDPLQAPVPDAHSMTFPQPGSAVAADVG